MKTIHLKIAAFLFACFFIFSCKKDNNSVKLPPRVNAGPAQVIALPVDSITLTGTVTDAGSKVVGYLWSEVSGPNVPVIASEGSLSTVVRGLTAGNYIFQLMATDTFGITGVDTMTVTVNPPTVIYLRGTIGTFDNELVGNATSTYVYTGGAGELGAEYWTINGTQVGVRSTFKFDFTTLPASTPVKSALLSLYSMPTPFTGNLSTPNAGPANAMYIQRINQNWAIPLTWTTQPGVDVTSQVSIPSTNATSLDLINVDVTPLVNAMITSGNYGFMIRLQNEVLYNSRIFCSNAQADSTKRPRLILSY